MNYIQEHLALNRINIMRLRHSSASASAHEAESRDMRLENLLLQRESVALQSDGLADGRRVNTRVIPLIERYTLAQEKSAQQLETLATRMTDIAYDLTHGDDVGVDLDVKPLGVPLEDGPRIPVSAVFRIVNEVTVSVALLDLIYASVPWYARWLPSTWLRLALETVVGDALHAVMQRVLLHPIVAEHNEEQAQGGTCSKGGCGGCSGDCA